jgi:hypothetical protein
MWVAGEKTWLLVRMYRISTWGLANDWRCMDLDSQLLGLVAYILGNICEQVEEWASRSSDEEIIAWLHFPSVLITLKHP